MESKRADFIAMNSEAVAMMHQGNHEGAAKLLWTALVGLKGQLNHSRSPLEEEEAIVDTTVTSAPASHHACDASHHHHDGDNIMMEAQDIEMYDDDEDDHDDEDLLLLQSVSIPSCEMCMQPRPGGRGEQNIFAFYPRAFTLTEDLQNYDDATRCCCVVLYNLALIQHLKALQKPLDECPCHLLAHARSLYMAAHDIACAGLEEDACLDLYCLQLALANNLGHIHAHSHTKVSDFSKMCDCLQGLMNLVAFPMSPVYLSEDDYEFFYMGVVTFQESPGLCLAPAA